MTLPATGPGWDEETDVVVAGGGGAGLRAAISAAQAGARVVLLEKTADPGGKTALSIGIMTASATPTQKAAGVRDTHAAHYADLERMAKAAGRTLDEPKVKFMIRECSREIANLADLGVKFSGPFGEGMHGTPRLHVVQPDCRRLAKLLIKECRNLGVDIRVRSPAAELLLDAKGRIAGVLAETPKGPRHIAARAVVLAAGDYSANAAFLDAVAPKAPRAEPLRAYATGDGHRVAMRVGAATHHMDQVNSPQLRMWDWPIVEPSPGLFAAGAVLVDAKGRRVRTKPGPSAVLPGFSGKRAEWGRDLYIVIDEKTAAKLATAADDGEIRDGWQTTGKPFIGTAPGVCYAYLADCQKWKWYKRAKSVKAAAKHIGTDPKTLKKTLNWTLAEAAPGPLHLLGPARRCLPNSGGGLVTDRRMRVLSLDGKPVAGLYGAGVNARLITFMGGHGYALAWAMASGRIAGESAARMAATSR